MAEPSGSLKAMLNTQITLIEYLELKVLISDLDNRVMNYTSSWQAGEQKYETFVSMSVKFDYGENKLIFLLTPEVYDSFNSLENARAYCRALIEYKLGEVFGKILLDTTANGWGNSGTNNKGYFDGIRKNTILKTSIPGSQIEGVKLPNNMLTFDCMAKMDETGEISSWSFNL